MTHKMERAASACTSTERNALKAEDVPTETIKIGKRELTIVPADWLEARGLGAWAYKPAIHRRGLTRTPATPQEYVRWLGYSAGKRELALLVASFLIGQRKGRSHSANCAQLACSVLRIPGVGSNPKSYLKASDDPTGTKHDMWWADAQVDGSPLSEEALSVAFTIGVLCALIEWAEQGPRQMLRLVEALVRKEASGQTRDGEERKRLSEAGADGKIGAARMIERVLITIRRDADHFGLSDDAIELVEKWQEVSNYNWGKSLGAPPRPNKKRGLTKRQIRRLWRCLLRDLELTEKSGTVRSRKHLPTAWRHMIVFLFFALGFRSDTVCWIRKRDFELEHEFMDGSVGPGIHITKLKGNVEVDRWQKVPPDFAALVVRYFAFVESLGHEQTDADPLILSLTPQTWQYDKVPYGQTYDSTITDMCVEFLVDSEITGHGFRHTAFQLSQAYGERQILARAKGELDESALHGFINDAGTYGKIVCDHKGVDKILATYSDSEVPGVRERVRAEAVTAPYGLWDQIAGGGGARLGPDIERITTASKQAFAAKAALAEVKLKAAEAEHALSRIVSEQDELGRSIDARFDELTELERAREVRAEQALARDKSRTEAELTILTSDREKARADSKAATGELTEAKAARIPLSDDLTDDQVSELFAEAENVEEMLSQSGAANPIVRNWMTAEELAWCFGDTVSVSTINRRLRGKFPNRRPDDPRNVIPPNPDGKHPKCLLQVGEGRYGRRILIDALPLDWYGKLTRERIDFISRQPAPKLQTSPEGVAA